MTDVLKKKPKKKKTHKNKTKQNKTKKQLNQSSPASSLEFGGGGCQRVVCLVINTEKVELYKINLILKLTVENGIRLRKCEFSLYFGI